MSSQYLRSLTATLTLLVGATASGEPSALFEQGQTAFEGEDWPGAIAALTQEVEQNPGHEMAYILLGQALEASAQALDTDGRTEEAKKAKDDAVAQWTKLLSVTKTEAVRRVARKGFLRCRDVDLSVWTGRDPFDVGLNIDYRHLQEIDDEEYVDWGGIGIPPIQKETKHFYIASCSEAMTETLGEVCEQVLAFLNERMLDGRAWPLRVPILCYKDHDDYVSVGKNPGGSLGVTVPSPLTLTTARIGMFQVANEEQMEFKGADHPVKGNLEGTLPHELTHMVLFEFFGGQIIPRWIGEGTARQLEQNRKDFEETAELARDSVSGEFIRFRDLFNAAEYPTGGENLRFYEQSAAVVIFLAEHGPEAFRAFLDELRLQRGHDAAAAAALGIPEDGAVEEFERQWVRWMQERYVKNLKETEEPDDCIHCSECDDCTECDDEEAKEDGCDAEPCVKCVKEGMSTEEIEALPCRPKCWSRARPTESPLYLPGFDLARTLEHENIGEWSPVPIRSLDDFRGVEGSKRHWKVDGDRLQCLLPDGSPTAALLAIKTYEDLPFVVRCQAQYTGDDDAGYFGFAQLDLAGDESGVQALARLTRGAPFEVMCVLESNLTLFLDGECAGRFPAVLPSAEDDDIDYPLAFVASAPIRIWGLETITLLGKDIALRSDQEEGEDQDEGRDPRPRPGRPPRRPGQPGVL
ncbi:MAG: hypothetical protein JSV19_07455 [Phycisphaerales bacterium]|nr:MAG: hypothetical protein JSV19_07455 [Phycisphaerales bacterium]